MRRLRPASAFLTATLLSAALPVCADATRAVIVGPATAEVVARLEDELVTLGLEVSVVEPGASLTWRTLSDLARAHEATAAIAVAPDLSEIAIWVVDRGTGEAHAHSITVPSGDPDESARIGALRAVELLRVGLRELGSGAPRPEAEAQAVQVTAPVEEEPARWWLDLAGGILWAPGGLDPVGTFAVGLRWRPLDFLSVGLGSSFPLAGGTVSAPEGEASVRPWRVFAEARWVPLGGRGWFQADVGLGLGFAVVTMEGTARVPFLSNEETLTVFAGHAVLGLELRPLAWLGVRLDTAVGMAIPEVGVVFADRRVARWGRPLVSTSLALTVGW
jgi:hypothetical protein